MIITVAHQKGGTGKSTIATNLAVELKTSLLDLDKQHSSIIFNYKRAHAGLEPLDCYSIAESQCRFDGQRPVPEAKLDEFLNLFKGDPKTDLVIDVGGFDSPLNRKALFFGDYLLTPCAPSGTEIYGLQMFTVRREQGRLAELAPVVAYFVLHTPTTATWRPGLALVYGELGRIADARRADHRRSHRRGRRVSLGRTRRSLGTSR